MLTPAFHFKILEDFTEVFLQKAQVLTDMLDKKTNGQEFDLLHDITLCTLDIIMG